MLKKSTQLIFLGAQVLKNKSLKSYEKLYLASHTQLIEIAGCPKFKLTTNACRGYCLSYTVPSNQDIISLNPLQRLTSVGSCCTMGETEDVAIIAILLGTKELNLRTHFLFVSRYAEREISQNYQYRMAVNKF
ncbi:hypothetical protein B4U80_02213 [Leptotrombidium deliense]|uniref:Uncharacterized protein n=1 Tax=Leptotrombidium deliense TaxID=299467 RepID=A0A443SKF0_9ACAR|nr:hypothetical protein B4U80_02213 [Leptotrombidium deliense]